jgi:diadenosine tetraphosphate (Ap4A) HIT family hydrolase
MTASPSASAQECIFCAIVAGQARASVVHTDEVAVVFMDRNPVTAGHLLVVPRVHAVGLEDLDESTGRHLWSVGHRMARALRRSGLRCEGINIFVADGEAAFQDVLHFHLHVLPRYNGDGFSIGATWPGRSRDLLDADAQAIMGALARGRLTP